MVASRPTDENLRFNCLYNERKRGSRLDVCDGREDMTGELTLPKAKPVDVVRQVLGAIEAGRDGVLVDHISRAVNARQGTIPDLGQEWSSSTSKLLSGGLP
jgi:hypothetical protein